jgi:hypothetical protein
MSELSRKNKLEAYQDKRHNLDDESEDKALEEIDFYIIKYIKLETEFHIKSKITKLLSIISLCTLVACVCLIYSHIIFDEELLSEVWRTSVCYVLTVTVVVFVACYFSNRLNGYTRGWSRNRLMLERLEIVRREYELAIKDEPQGVLTEDQIIQKNVWFTTEKNNALTKLFELETQNRIETHKDIVGDYLAAHEGTFSWIKGLKK